MSTIKAINIQHPSASSAAITLTTDGKTSGVGVTTICTSSTRPSLPVEGQMIYETDKDLEYFYNGSSWVERNKIRAMYFAEGSGTYNTFNYPSTKTRISSYDISVTSKGLNSRWIASHHNWFGSRTSAVGAEIWYTANGGSSFSCLGRVDTNTYAMVWDTVSTDAWNGFTWTQNGIITASAGTTITFTLYAASFGPGGTDGDTTAADAIGHPNTNYQWTIYEVAP